MRSLSVALAVLLLSGMAMAQGPVDTSYRSQCTAFPYDSGTQEVSTAQWASLTVTRTCVTSITFVNTTSSPIFVRVWDGNRKLYVSQFVYPFSAPVVISLNNIQFSGGIQWTASSSGLNAQVKALQ